MVAQGGSGLHYPFTFETFKYMVVVLNRHFETLLEFLKQKRHVPDQRHHAKGELAVSIFSKKKQKNVTRNRKEK
jgi:shikimate kinase